MKTNIPSPKRSERGQSLVELALSLTILLILLAGIIDLGMAFFTWIELRDAAQEGAVFGAIGYGDPNTPATDETVTVRLLDSATTPVNLHDAYDNGELQLTIIRSTPTCMGQPITVELDYTYRLIVPLVGIALPPGPDGDTQTIQVRARVTDTVLRSEPACP